MVSSDKWNSILKRNDSDDDYDGKYLMVCIMVIMTLMNFHEVRSLMYNM